MSTRVWLSPWKKGQRNEGWDYLLTGGSSRREVKGAAALTLSGSAIVLFSVVNYELVASTGAIGPGLMPVVAGAMIAISSFLVLAQAAPPKEDTQEGRETHPQSQNERPPSNAGTDDSVDSDESPIEPTATGHGAERGTGQVLALLAIMVAATVAIPIVGFEICAAATVFAILRLVERVRFARAATIAVSTGLALWLIVAYLSIPMPSGLLP